MKETGLVRWQAVLLTRDDKEPSMSSSVDMAWLRSRLEVKPGALNSTINHRNLETVAYPCVSVLHLKTTWQIPTSASTVIWVADGSDYTTTFLRNLSAISTRIWQEIQSDGNNEWMKGLVSHGLAQAVCVVLLCRETVIQQSEDESFSMFLQESVTSKVDTESTAPGRLSRLDYTLAKLGNQGLSKALDDRISCTRCSGDDGLCNIIRLVSDAWQTVAGSIKDERQKRPTEFSHSQEHFAKIKIEVTERMHLPLPSQTE